MLNGQWEIPDWSSEERRTDGTFKFVGCQHLYETE